MRAKLLSVLLVSMCCVIVRAQTPTQPAGQAPQVGPQSDRDPLSPAPRRRADEGRGPFKSLVVRGAILIDGTGAPPVGPVDIVIEGNRIRRCAAPAPRDFRRAESPPQKPDLEIDATGMYLMPGFVNLHEHAGGAPRTRMPSTSTSCGWRTASRPFAACRWHRSRAVSERERSAAQRDRRAAHRQLSASWHGLGARARRHAREARASGCGGARRTASTA